MKTYVDNALEAASLGIPVEFIPKGEKACKTTGWQNTCTTDPNKIVERAKQNPNLTNYGLVAKAEPGGHLFLDDDGGIRAEYEKQHDMAPTRKQQSQSGAFHYIYKHSAKSLQFHEQTGKSYIDEPKPNDEKGELWSLRMHNAYIVGAGSVFDGREYKVAWDAAVIEIPDTLLDFLIDRWEKSKQAEKAKSFTASTGPTQKTKRRTKQDWQAELNSNEPIQDGARNSRLISIAGYLHHVMKYEKEMLNITLQAINTRRCQPPLKDEEVETIAGSANKYKDDVGKADIKKGSEYSLQEVKEMVDLLVYADPDDRAASGVKVPKNTKRAANTAVELIYTHLKARVQFFNADGIGYILKPDGKTIAVSHDDPYFRELISMYGINPGDEEFVKVGKYITMKTMVEGTKTSVRYTSHYNPNTKCFYLADSSHLIRGDGEKLERVPNGTDGELFILKDNQRPFEINLDKLPDVKYSLITGTDSLLSNLLFKDLVFEPSSLGDEGKRILLTTYTILLVLAGIADDRPILQMIGPSGCGKTHWLRLLGRMLVGTTFNVQKLDNQGKEFENVLVNNDIAFFDNVDMVSPEVRNLLCMAVTGYDIERRELFTTMGRIKVPSKATVGISSLEPVLPTTEQANRSVAIMLKARPSGTNVDAKVLLEEFDAASGALLAEVICRAQMVLKALKAQEGYRSNVVSRLAGFATLILKVARHEGWESMAKSVLESWNNEQLDVALSGDDVADAIRAWMSKPGWESQPLYAGQLSTQLVSASGQEAKHLSWAGSARSLSTVLVKSKESYKHRFGMEAWDDKSTKTTCFQFKPSEAMLTALRGGEAMDGAVPAEINLGDEMKTEILDLNSFAPTPIESTYLSPADYRWVPEANEPIRQQVVYWAKVLTQGGWAPTNQVCTQAVVLFCVYAAGRGDHEGYRDMGEQQWKVGFDLLKGAWESGGSQAVAAANLPATAVTAMTAVFQRAACAKVVEAVQKVIWTHLSACGANGAKKDFML